MEDAGNSTGTGRRRTQAIQRILLAGGFTLGGLAFVLILVGARRFIVEGAPAYGWFAIAMFLAGVGSLVLGTGRGILLVLDPDGVGGLLRDQAYETGSPRSYGWAMAWIGLVLGVALIVAGILTARQQPAPSTLVLPWAFAVAVLPLYAVYVVGWIRQWRRGRVP